MRLGYGVFIGLSERQSQRLVRLVRNDCSNASIRYVAIELLVELLQ